MASAVALFCVPWHDEMSRDGAVVKVPATEGLCSHELTITLANVLEVDPVQFSINVPLGGRPCITPCSPARA